MKKTQKNQKKEIQNKISTPGQLRMLLLESAVALLEGRINCAQANALVGLSGEVHKSVKLEWDMGTFASTEISLETINVVNSLQIALDEE